MTKTGNTLYRSFANAFRGIRQAFTERNMKIHLSIGTAALTLAVCTGITETEWMILVMNIAAVIAAEIFNTAVEHLSDKVCADYDETIKTVKDISAAGVVVMAFCSLITGSMIFIPRLGYLLSSF